MRFVAPYLLILLVLVPWTLMSGRRNHAPRRVWRALSMALLVLAAAGLEIRGGILPRAVVFVLDRSDSMALEHRSAIERVAALQHNMRSGDQASLIVFGSDAAVEDTPRATPVSADPIESRVSTAGTNLEAALRLARLSLPPAGDRRMVLLSDGQQTSGSALREAALAALDQIPIDVAFPADGSAAGAWEVRQVTAPTVATLGDTFVISATVAGTPGFDALVSLRGPISREQSVRLSPRGEAGVAFNVSAAAPGLHTYEVSVRARDDQFDLGFSPPLGAVVAVSSPPRILYVSSGSRVLQSTLARHRFQVDTTAPESVSRSSAALATYDGVVLDDVEVDRLDTHQQDALRSFVEEHGGGLLMLGAADTLGPTVLPDQGIGALLPVDFRSRAGQRAPGMALVVAFDKSGSMDTRIGGMPRIEFARQAVARVLESISFSDELGVVAFDGAAHEVVPLAAGHDARWIRGMLDAVVPGGPTAVAPALQLAAGWLHGAGEATRGRRHVLLVSDGKTSTSDAERTFALVRDAGFEISVVALGAGADRQFLQRLAASTGGRAYFPETILELPAIAARESARISGGRMFEGRFRPRAQPHPVLAGIDTRLIPSLDGYVVGAVRPSAVSLLESPLNDPILASWRVGLGKAGVYTADLDGPWSDDLRAWSGSDRLFGRLVRWLARQVHEESLYARFVVDGDVLRMVVHAQSPTGEDLNGLTCEATVRTPAGDVRQVSLHATAPGRYEAVLDGLMPGVHPVQLTATSAGRAIDARMLRGFYWNAAAEHRRGVDRETLQQIATTAGGRVLARAESAFANDRRSHFIEGWPWLSGAALLLFMGEIVLPRPLRLAARFRRLQPWAAPQERSTA